MKIAVFNYPEKIEFELENITQLCGQNIRRKQMVINSLTKYFSNEKYTEADEQFRGNVYIDDEQIGRNFFKVIRITGIEDVLSFIKMGKATLLSQYIRRRLDSFDCGNQLACVEDKLSEIFDIINREMAETIGNIALDFTTSDLWDMVQKSKAYSQNGGAVELNSAIDLLRILVNLIINNKDIGDRIIIIIENIDHMLDVHEYKIFLDEMKKYGDIYNIYTLVSTSLEGYTLARLDVIEGISVFNNVDFSFPDAEKLVTFINENYPYHRLFEYDEVFDYIEKVAQRIGREGYMIKNVEMTICKMINDTLLEPEIRIDNENSAVIAFLNGGYMV